MITEKQENVIHGNLSEVSRHLAGCKCACCGGASSDSTIIKEPPLFCNFNFTYLPCYLHLPDITSDGGGSLEGQVHSLLQAAEKCL
jgi:hypothetical protein